MQSLHKDRFQLRYLVMPDYIYSDKRLTDISRRVYSFIHSYKNPFFFSNEHMAEMFNCSERGVEDAIALLKEVGYIRVEHKQKSGGGKIRLTVDCGLEPQETVVSVEKDEATNHSVLGNKEDKENNEMSDFSELLPKRQEDRQPKVGFGSRSPFPYRKEKPSGPGPRRGVSAEHIK